MCAFRVEDNKLDCKANKEALCPKRPKSRRISHVERSKPLNINGKDAISEEKTGSNSNSKQTQQHLLSSSGQIIPKDKSGGIHSGSMDEIPDENNFGGHKNNKKHNTGIYMCKFLK